MSLGISFTPPTCALLSARRVLSEIALYVLLATLIANLAQGLIHIVLHVNLHI